MSQSRKIIHIDLDCFYAAIEVRDNPALKGKPVAVGGLSSQRGVLCTCNYEARKYGLHSAMPTVKAFQLCSNLKLLPVDMEKYQAASQEIQKIFKNYTENIEFLSLDEAFLDVTGSKMYRGSATLIAQAIRQEIKAKQGLTASAGVAPNKFLAKVASEWRKPDGLFVIIPEEVDAFIKVLPITKIFGVGQVTAKKIFSLGINTCADLQKLSLSELMSAFGSFGARLHKLCRGVDDREVETDRERKSISVEETYWSDLPNQEDGILQLPLLLERLQSRLDESEDLKIVKIYVKIKFNDFSHTTAESLSAGELEIKAYEVLFKKGYQRQNKPIRLIGLGVRLQPIKESKQLTLEGF
ncbi:MAG: DNA polymerase IV [Gammaproteobacteria bacterium GWE2_37_16]|nr:MAG: DNA polymerase IV [Gammaproteobacteria bacterium GWE2_37_16]